LPELGIQLRAGATKPGRRIWQSPAISVLSRGSEQRNPLTSALSPGDKSGNGEQAPVAPLMHTQAQDQRAPSIRFTRRGHRVLPDAWSEAVAGPGPVQSLAWPAWLTEILEPYPAPRTHAGAGRRDAIEGSRIVLQAVTEPVVLGLESDQHLAHAPGQD